MRGRSLIGIVFLLCVGIYTGSDAGSSKGRDWLKGKCGGDGALAFAYNNKVYLVELSNGNKQEVGNGGYAEFSLDASILAWQDEGAKAIKGRLRKGDTQVRTLIEGVEDDCGVHWISDKEFVCYKDGKFLIVDAFSGNTREDADLNSIDMKSDNEGDVKLCDDGVWVVLKRNMIKMSNGEESTRPGRCSGSLSPDGRSATGLHHGHAECELKAIRDGGYSGTLHRVLSGCNDGKGFDNHRWSSNSKDFIVAQHECSNKVGVWDVGTSDVCILASCGGETYGDFTVGSPKVTEWKATPADESKPTAPSGLSGEAVSRTQIDLSWSAAEDNESGIAKYLVYRDGQKIGETASTSYSDEDCSEGSTCNYSVSAVNGAGLQGDKCEEKSVSTGADESAPEIVSVSATGSGTAVTVVFSEAVEKTGAEQAANYSIDNSVTVSGAALAGDGRTVTLTVSGLSQGTTYTLSVSNVTDMAATPNTVAAGTEASFELVPYTAGEVAYQLFDGSFSTLPDCDALTPAEEGTVAGFAIAEVTSKSSDYCIRFTGMIKVDDEGEYTFATSSDDGSALYVGGTKVVDNDGVHGVEEKSGTITLSAGMHPIVVVYFQGSGGQGLGVSWKAPGAGSLESIPVDRLYAADASSVTASGHLRSEARVSGRVIAVARAGDCVTVSNLDPSRTHILRIVDSSGRVLTSTVSSGSNEAVTSLPEAARGLLLLHVEDGSTRVTRKILRR